MACRIRLIVLLVLGLGLAACGADEHGIEVADSFYAAKGAHGLWCAPLPHDQVAIELVVSAYGGAVEPAHHGGTDPYGRHAGAVIDNLTSRTNPNGEGTLVTGWSQQYHQSGKTRYSRDLRVWLVLDGGLYGLTQDSINDLGYLWDGVPPEVDARSGMPFSYERGESIPDQLGFEFEQTISRQAPFRDCGG